MVIGNHTESAWTEGVAERHAFCECSMAFKMTSSFLMQATIATFEGLPAASKCL
jgi:hypothetical protein